MAMIRFSASEMSRLFRSGPATMRSRDSLNSAMPMVFRLRRAARMAASLTRLARSAPEKPADWRARTSLSIDGVNLVDEDDAWRVPLGLIEQVADAARADANEHLDELGTGDGEEGNARFTGHRS